MAAQGQDDRICGKTIRWRFSEGPVQGKSFEHRFRDDGTVVWRELGGAAPAQGDQETGVPYTAQRLSDDVGLASYLAGSGYTLTVALNFDTGELRGVASNEKHWYPLRGTFEIA